jgi:hypothetical protein
VAQGQAGRGALGGRSELSGSFAEVVMRLRSNDRSWLVPFAGSLLFVACYALIMWVHPWSDDRISDIRLYAGVAHSIAIGRLPYRDFLFGYPPLAIPVMLLGGIGGTSYEAYRDTFMWFMLLVGISLVPLTWVVARKTRANEIVAVGAVAISPLLLGAMLRTHFDLVPVALTVAALALLVSERPRAGFAVLGVAIAVKGYPLVVAVVAVPWLYKHAGRRVCLQAVGILAAVVGPILIAGLAVSGHGALSSLSDQLSRPAEIESTGASILFALGHLGFTYPTVNTAAASWGLSAPEAGAVAALLDVVALASMVAITWLVWRRGDNRALVLGSLTATVVFAACGKVLSPQYLIWVIPLFALAAAWRMRALAAAVGAAMLLTFIMFPIHFHDVVFQRTPWLVEVGVRNLLLLGAIALAIRELAAERVAVPVEQREPVLAHAVAPAPQPLLDVRS